MTREHSGRGRKGTTRREDEHLIALEIANGELISKFYRILISSNDRIVLLLSKRSSHSIKWQIVICTGAKWPSVICTHPLDTQRHTNVERQRQQMRLWMGFCRRQRNGYVYRRSFQFYLMLFNCNLVCGNIYILESQRRIARGDTRCVSTWEHQVYRSPCATIKMRNVYWMSFRRKEKMAMRERERRIEQCYNIEECIRWRNV